MSYWHAPRTSASNPCDTHEIMSDESLIVPTVLPSGTLHFVTIKHDGTAEDVLNLLSSNVEATSEILGDLQPYGWALQSVRKHTNGRHWEEEELEALGNGPPMLASYNFRLQLT